MGSSRVAMELQTNAEKAFHYFIHDYMLRKKYDNSAMLFSMETAALPQPTIPGGGTVSIENSDDGFLWDWWVIFADVYFAHMKQRKAEYEASLSPKQLQQLAAATRRQILLQQQQQQQQQQSKANVSPAALSVGRTPMTPCSPRPGPVRVHKGQQQQRKWGPTHLHRDTGMRRLVLHDDKGTPTLVPARSTSSPLFELEPRNRHLVNRNISPVDAGRTRGFGGGGSVRRRLDFSDHTNVDPTRSASTADSMRQLQFQQSSTINGPGDNSTGNVSETIIPYDVPPSPSVSNTISLQDGGRNDSSQLTGNIFSIYDIDDSNDNVNNNNNVVMASSSSPQHSWPSSSISTPPEWSQVPLVIASPRPPLSLGVDLSPPAESQTLPHMHCHSSCWSSDPQQLSSSSNRAPSLQQVNVLPGTPSTIASCNNNVSHPPEDGNDQIKTTPMNDEEIQRKSLGVSTGFQKSSESESPRDDELGKGALDVVHDGSELNNATNSTSKDRAEAGSELNNATNSTSKDRAEAAAVATASEQAEAPSSTSKGTVTINHEKDSILKRMKQLARSRCQSKTASRQKQRRVNHQGGGGGGVVEGTALDVLHVDEASQGNTHGRRAPRGTKPPLDAESRSLPLTGDPNIKRNDPKPEPTSAKAESAKAGTMSTVSAGVLAGVSIYSPRGSGSMHTEQESAPAVEVLQPSSSDILMPPGTNENHVGSNKCNTVGTHEELDPLPELGLGEVAEAVNFHAPSLDLIFAELGAFLESDHECSDMDKLWPELIQGSGGHDGGNLEAENKGADCL